MFARRYGSKSHLFDSGVMMGPESHSVCYLSGPHMKMDSWILVRQRSRRNGWLAKLVLLCGREYLFGSSVPVSIAGRDVRIPSCGS